MYIARQAIFDRELKVYGYELLYRKSINSTQYDGVSSVQSSAAVLNGLYEIGLNKISDNKISFINFDSLSIVLLTTTAAVNKALSSTCKSCNLLSSILKRFSQ